MQKFDAIRPFYDTEINSALLEVKDHPMMKALMNFAFPGVPNEHWKEQLTKTHSTRDFQCNFIYQALTQILKKSSDGMTTSGFDTLDPNTAYIFISNHRDIILDTSLLNACLFDNGLVMTASAIGDNLVKKAFSTEISWYKEVCRHVKCYKVLNFSRNILAIFCSGKIVRYGLHSVKDERKTATMRHIKVF